MIFSLLSVVKFKFLFSINFVCVCMSVQALLSDYCLYKYVPGPPVEVGVTMYVLSISSVSEVLMVHSSYHKNK